MVRVFMNHGIVDNFGSCDMTHSDEIALIKEHAPY